MLLIYLPTKYSTRERSHKTVFVFVTPRVEVYQRFHVIYIHLQDMFMLQEKGFLILKEVGVEIKKATPSASRKNYIFWCALFRMTRQRKHKYKI